LIDEDEKIDQQDEEIDGDDEETAFESVFVEREFVRVIYYLGSVNVDF
jgi:hypothetical protein